ncbi:hypothetical protein [Psittacicella hinzii]|uniref:Uncharacterized protein n=1 Tax=Psittacicella hinzii TaxID=2028575 RepID=A0A3A1YT40_9GAMM|nr:hypothetical protein [Psittacicella hinzii]RIY40805.1 hypothetical protein CKF58_00160 [Psittacicella hinzii]
MSSAVLSSCKALLLVKDKLGLAATKFWFTVSKLGLSTRKLGLTTIASLSLFTLSASPAQALTYTQVKANFAAKTYSLPGVATPDNLYEFFADSKKTNYTPTLIASVNCDLGENLKRNMDIYFVTAQVKA